MRKNKGYWIRSGIVLLNCAAVRSHVFIQHLNSRPRAHVITGVSLDRSRPPGNPKMWITKKITRRAVKRGTCPAHLREAGDPASLLSTNHIANAFKKHHQFTIPQQRRPPPATALRCSVCRPDTAVEEAASAQKHWPK